MVSEASPERGRGQGLALGVDDLGALLPLGLGLPGHRPLHAVGQLDVLELDQGHLDTPVDGGDVEDLADVEVDPVGLGQRLVQGVLADDLAQRGLGDLVDRGVDVLDRDDRLHRVDDPEVGDRRHVDADVVAGDDALRLDRHRDDPQRHPVQHVDERDDEPQPGLAYAEHPAEPEQHALLVLLDDPHRHRQHQQQHDDDNNDDDDQRVHRRAPVGELCWGLPAATVVFAGRDEGADRGEKHRREQLCGTVMVILMRRRSPARRGLGAKAPGVLRRTAEPIPNQLNSQHLRRYTRWDAPHRMSFGLKAHSQAWPAFGPMPGIAIADSVLTAGGSTFEGAPSRGGYAAAISPCPV